MACKGETLYHQTYTLQYINVDLFVPTKYTYRYHANRLKWLTNVYLKKNPSTVEFAYNEQAYNEVKHSQKSWVILLMNIHKPKRVMYDVSK